MVFGVNDVILMVFVCDFDGFCERTSNEGCLMDFDVLMRVFVCDFDGF
jgi:hypothetical protein